MVYFKSTIFPQPVTMYPVVNKLDQTYLDFPKQVIQPIIEIKSCTRNGFFLLIENI